MDLFQLTDRFTTACSEQSQDALQDLAQELGYTEPEKTATNLRLLFEAIGDSPMIARLAMQGLDCADPDLSLNNLERLTDTLDAELYQPVLVDLEQSKQLLTILGASQFLTGILCR